MTKIIEVLTLLVGVLGEIARAVKIIKSKEGQNETGKNVTRKEQSVVSQNSEQNPQEERKPSPDARRNSPLG